jgi:hypothetical protein
VILEYLAVAIRFARVKRRSAVPRRRAVVALAAVAGLHACDGSSPATRTVPGGDRLAPPSMPPNDDLDVYEVFTAPDGMHKIIVLRDAVARFLPHAFGGGGDDPAVLRLVDASGTVLREQPAMFDRHPCPCNMIPPPEWGRDSVKVDAIVDRWSWR